jgi:hypothetical protein
MTLENGKKIILLRLIGFISTLVYVLYVFLAYFPKVFKNALAEKHLTLLTILITSVFLVVLFWPSIRRFRYIFFSADERTITLGWYKPGLLPGESRSIEIPSDRLAGYEVKKEVMGLHRYLILFQQVQGKRAAYPPVSISALSKAQLGQIEMTLKDYNSTI